MCCAGELHGVDIGEDSLKPRGFETKWTREGLFDHWSFDTPSLIPVLGLFDFINDDFNDLMSWLYEDLGLFLGDYVLFSLHSGRIHPSRV